MVADTMTKTQADIMIDRIRASAAALRDQVKVNDDLGRLSDETMELLADIGVLNALTPAKYGGADLSPSDTVRVFEELSYVDTSISWVALIPGVHGKNFLLVDPDVRDALSVAGYPFIAGQGAPTGRAIRTQGGYRISGRWSYGSGILHASMADGLAVVEEDGRVVTDENGDPLLILFFTPIRNVVFAGNWDVIGLKATGSVDYTLDDVFVPTEQTVQRVFTTPLGGEGLDKYFSLLGWLLTFHAAHALGAGRRLMDELAAIASKSGRRDQRLVDNPRFGYRYGKAEAAYRAARAFLLETLGGIERKMDDRQLTTRRDVTNIRAACLLIHDVNGETAAFAFKECGGKALRDGSLQRVYRDIVAMGQHILVEPAAWAECAKDYLGLADQMTWGYDRLV